MRLKFQPRLYPTTFLLGISIDWYYMVDQTSRYRAYSILLGPLELGFLDINNKEVLEDKKWITSIKK